MTEEKEFFAGKARYMPQWPQQNQLVFGHIYSVRLFRDQWELINPKGSRVVIDEIHLEDAGAGVCGLRMHDIIKGRLLTDLDMREHAEQTRYKPHTELTVEDLDVADGTFRASDGQWYEAFCVDIVKRKTS